MSDHKPRLAQRLRRSHRKAQLRLAHLPEGGLYTRRTGEGRCEIYTGTTHRSVIVADTWNKAWAELWARSGLVD